MSCLMEGFCLISDMKGRGLLEYFVNNIVAGSMKLLLTKNDIFLEYLSWL